MQKEYVLFKVSKINILTDLIYAVFLLFVSSYLLIGGIESFLDVESNILFYFLGYVSILGAGLGFYFFYISYKTFVRNLNDIVLTEDGQMIYKRKDKIVNQFYLNEIEDITENRLSNIYYLHLKNKKIVTLPYQLQNLEYFVHKCLENVSLDNIQYPIKINAKKSKALYIFLFLLGIPVFFGLVLNVFNNPFFVLILILVFVIVFKQITFKPAKSLVINEESIELQLMKDKKSYLKQEVKNILFERFDYDSQQNVCKIVTFDDKYQLEYLHFPDLKVYLLLKKWLNS
jgi:hypothetical protein